jgi:hypothetical protein
MRNAHTTYISLLKVEKLCFFALLLLLLGSHAGAQQMHFRLVVENEFAVTGFRYPDFGNIPVNSGWAYLPVESEQAGFFNISATENIPLIATIQPPERLVRDSSNTISLRLEAAFVRDGQTNPALAKPFADNYASFTLSSRGMLIDKNYTWLNELQTNVFLYGAVDVGDVAPGVYFGEVMISLEYL